MNLRQTYLTKIVYKGNLTPEINFYAKKRREIQFFECRSMEEENMNSNLVF